MRRVTMPQVRYALRQSTDEDAFLPITPPVLKCSQSTKASPAFGAISQGPKSGLSIQEVRDRGLGNVKERMVSRESGGRMRRKVGIVTGVGPIAGIGVSPSL
jgi:hypothetical protein